MPGNAAVFLLFVTWLEVVALPVHADARGVSCNAGTLVAVGRETGSPHPEAMQTIAIKADRPRP